MKQDSSSDALLGSRLHREENPAFLFFNASSYEAMLKSILRRCVPRRLRPISYLLRLTERQTSLTVLSGPFAGTRYVRDAVASTYLPKLLGCYERELHHIIEAIQEAGFAHVINIGAGEGYYAIGLARSLPAATVYAFETLKRGRELISEMALLNEVHGRVHVLGRCGHAELCETLHDPSSTVIICDVEGQEYELLDPSRVPQLTRVAILVEVHEFVQAGLMSVLKARFALTHAIEEILPQERTPSEFPFRTLYTSLLPKTYLRRALSELRSGVTPWLWMHPVAYSSLAPRAATQCGET